ncbi:potassium channel AKT6-like [Phalaenopsis equestris]|uniref:potassium channel AKT6-like n=1 Tax=Phalaenopsis equestris TaxID=78828 RepID=UPI0009E3D915|nr:potassium channel AKT6-like [Phalaenopsis equestris]
MQVEYFPPKEDIVLQDEVPTDLYILVSGAVVSCCYYSSVSGLLIQVQGRAYAGDIVGEVGVLYNIPEPFTIRTIELSQILRLSKNILVNIIRESIMDGAIIMNNLLQKLETNGNLLVEHKGLAPFPNNQFFSLLYQEGYQDPRKTWMAPECTDSNLAMAAQFEMKNTCFKVNMGEVQNFGCERAFFEKQGQINHEYSMKSEENLLNKSNNNSECQIQRIMEQESHFRHLNPEITVPNWSEGAVHPMLSNAVRLAIPRVTIHMVSKVTHGSRENFGKLILLPKSINELLIIGGQKFKGFKPTKVVNKQNAEIDDVNAVRDGDHVYLIQEQ